MNIAIKIIRNTNDARKELSEIVELLEEIGYSDEGDDLFDIRVGNDASIFVIKSFNTKYMESLVNVFDRANKRTKDYRILYTVSGKKDV